MLLSHSSDQFMDQDQYDAIAGGGGIGSKLRLQARNQLRQKSRLQTLTVFAMRRGMSSLVSGSLHGLTHSFLPVKNEKPSTDS